MKSKYKLLSVFTIVVVTLCFGFYILKNKIIISSISNNYLDVVCPSDLDLNKDETIDIDDKVYFEELINSEIEESLLEYDFNGDDVTDIDDLIIYNGCYDEYFDYSFEINDDNIVYNMTNMTISRVYLNMKTIDFLALFSVEDKELSLFSSDEEMNADDDFVKTGDKLAIKNISGNYQYYTISVIGDVTGDGQSSIEDIKMISSHIIDKNILLEDAYLLAADIDGNSEIKMNDVMRLVKIIEEKNSEA